MQAEARASRIQGVRHDVLDVLARECPDVDLTAAALIVTELVANVVRHAYTEKGSVEVEVSCEPEAAVLTVRDWGLGFGEPRSADLPRSRCS